MMTTQNISDPAPAARAAKMYLVAAFAVGQALHVNDGNLHPVALLWITLAMIAVVFGLTGRGAWLDRFSVTKIAVVCLAIEWIDLVAWGIGFRRAPGASSIGFVIPMLIAGFGATLLFSKSRERLGLMMLIAGHFFAGADVIRSTKPPVIDALYFQEQSTAALVHGENPYTVRYRNIYGASTAYYSAAICDGDYLTVSHPYPPLTLLLAAPARVTGDLRWSHLIALELAAVLMVISYAREHETGDRIYSCQSLCGIAPAMMLFCPRALMVVYFGWTETFVVLCIAAVVCFAVRRPRWSWVVLGLAIASKQYMVLALPTMWLIADRKTLIKSITLAAGITLPFVLWSPAAFFRSVVLMQMLQPFRLDALSFPAILARFTGLQIPSIVAFIAAGIAIVWSIRRAPRSVGGFSAAVTLVFLVFFALNKQAFCNYYFLTAATSCCAAATSLRRVAVVEIQQALELKRAA